MSPIRIRFSDKLYEKEQWSTEEAKKVIEIAMGKRACTFDPMEKRYTRSMKTTTNDTQTIFHDS
jgi:Ca2+-transporting ATPase